ncbi:MAG: endopeptidase La [Lentisphaerae bacterium]|nr:endopeptidase La [Lentisphaerota bacterium]
MAKKKKSRDRLDDDSVDIELIPETEGGETSAETNLVLARDIFPGQLPIIPLNHRPLFPKMQVPMIVENETLREMLVATFKADRKFVGLVLRKPNGRADTDEPARGSDLYPVGVIAEILDLQRPHQRGPIQVLLGALERFRIVDVAQDMPHIITKVEYLFEADVTRDDELKAYSLAVVKSLKELMQLNPLHREEMALLMAQSPVNEPGRLADFAAAMTSAEPRELQDVLSAIRITPRLAKVLVLLTKEIDISKLQVKISKQIEEKLTTQQREFFLREQLKAIKKELGLEKEGKEAEAERFEKRIKALTLSDEARERIDEELNKIKLIEPASPEFNVSRTYLDWLTVLPWGVFTKDSFDIAKASKILDRDHYGLDDVKTRILEFLSVGILKGNISGSILCFVGPPGVGKTSIGQSIARSIGRNFYRFSVGGIQDEAEIKGHRRTYIGALPGKFIQAIKTCKSSNPVIMLDEIDKIGQSYRGDPASALLEVLDPEQNKEFLDHYLDVRFDLSNVFFICTANQLDTIPRPLLDRMEVITLSGYILEEKLQIARRYLLPKQLKAHGVARAQLAIGMRALRRIIDGYAREPGVRGVEKHIKRIVRKSVKRIVEGHNEKISVDADDVEALLGKPVFTDDDFFKNPGVGIITGLAWTSMGGDTLAIEATHVNTGKAGFKQTGQLGEVMVESSEIAYTYIRGFLSDHATARDILYNQLIHLHVPAGATPKDGPSAGITMAAALYSLVTGKRIRKGFAMTGELSLTGRVMPIGGVKEKTIAAKRAGIRNLVFPAANRKDFEELPAHIRKGLKPNYVSTFPEVVDVCF